MLSAAHIAVNSFDRKNGIIVYTETTYGVSQRFYAGNHRLLGRGGIGLVPHHVPDDNGCLEAYPPKEPHIASIIFGGHGSLDVKSDSVKR